MIADDRRLQIVNSSAIIWKLTCEIAEDRRRLNHVLSSAIICECTIIWKPQFCAIRAHPIIRRLDSATKWILRRAVEWIKPCQYKPIVFARCDPGWVTECICLDKFNYPLKLHGRFSKLSNNSEIKVVTFTLAVNEIRTFRKIFIVFSFLNL